MPFTVFMLSERGLKSGLTSGVNRSSSGTTCSAPTIAAVRLPSNTSGPPGVSRALLSFVP